MRILLLSLALFTSSAFAYPITYVFTGEVTRIHLVAGRGSEAVVVADDPWSSVSWNGVDVVNGNPHIVGTFTFESDTPRAGGSPDGPWPNPFNLLWQFTTEGIAFDKTAGRICGPCYFNYDESGVISHIEYLESSTSTSALMGWNYMDFEFHFTDGAFSGGSFHFVAEGDIQGGMSGVIDRVFVVDVPEPSSFLLMTSGLLLIGLLCGARHRKQLEMGESV